MMIIVDSSVWIDFVRGTQNAHTSWLREHEGTVKIGLTDLILCELLQGTTNQVEFSRTLERLLLFPVLPCAGTALAIAAARHYTLLREHGITIRKTIDCLIATFCLVHGHTLLHRDRDFDYFEREFGLIVVNI